MHVLSQMLKKSTPSIVQIDLHVDGSLGSKQARSVSWVTRLGLLQLLGLLVLGLVVLRSRQAWHVND
jgi:hypothetical protein